MDGIILCKKPSGITSNRIARTISKKYKIKVGNTGILDFAATGLIILVIGKATKFTQFFQNLDKEYIAVGELGKATDTYDINGDIIDQKEVKIDENSLVKVINSFIGKQEMLPPAFSSKKINGKRAYRYALKGEQIALKPIKVNIYNIDILSIDLPYFKIKVHCSTGTYIRSLVKNIGDKTENLAYMYSLERTKIGNFSISDAIDYEYLLSLSKEKFISKIISIKNAIYFYPSLKINMIDAKKFKNGQRISLNTQQIKSYNEFYETVSSPNQKIEYNKSIENMKFIKVIDINDNFIGLATIMEDGRLQPKIVL